MIWILSLNLSTRILLNLKIFPHKLKGHRHKKVEYIHSINVNYYQNINWSVQTTCNWMHSNTGSYKKKGGLMSLSRFLNSSVYRNREILYTGFCTLISSDFLIFVDFKYKSVDLYLKSMKIRVKTDRENTGCFRTFPTFRDMYSSAMCLVMHNSK